MTDKRRPVHVPVLVGASAALYAASLAGVTALQSAADRATIEARAPAAAAVDRLAARNDAVAKALDGLRGRMDATGTDYGAAADALGSVEVRLGDLATTVADVAGQVAALPDRIALPSVPRAPAGRAAPSVHAVTGASGK